MWGPSLECWVIHWSLGDLLESGAVYWSIAMFFGVKGGLFESLIVHWSLESFLGVWGSLFDVVYCSLKFFIRGFFLFGT